MPLSQPKYFAVVPAAGIGSRMSLGLPKQYILINGYPLITYTLSMFLANDRFEKISVAISANDEYWEKISLIDKSSQDRLVACHGGASRAESVLAAIEALKPYANKYDWVFVHDAARCGLNDNLLSRLFETLEKQTDPTGAILAVPVVDSLKKVNQAGIILASADRRIYWQAQTPQCFPYGLLKNALHEVLASENSSNSDRITDESSAMELQGVFAEVVLSSNENMKVTCDEDLELMQTIVEKQIARGDRCSPAAFFKKTESRG